MIVFKRSVWISLVLCIAVVGALPYSAMANSEFVMPKVTVAPQIDGNINDQAWQLAKEKGGYTTELYPYNGTEVVKDVKTEIWWAWDSEYVYFAFRNYQDMSTLMGDDPKVFASASTVDHNEIFVAPLWPTPTPYYQFLINPSGAYLDGKIKDKSWEAKGLKIKTMKYADNYVIEVAIPFSALEVKPPSAGTSWGFNVTRRMVKANQEMNLVPMIMSYHTPEKFKTVKFIE